MVCNMNVDQGIILKINFADIDLIFSSLPIIVIGIVFSIHGKFPIAELAGYTSEV